MGTIRSPGQWSISGGTGELTMARGIVNHKVVQEANGVSRVYEIEIHAYYTPMNSMVSGVAIPGIDVALLPLLQNMPLFQIIYPGYLWARD